MEQGIRLQKYMAEAGIGSRRKCEEWISKGMVQVNGRVVTELGTRVLFEESLWSRHQKHVLPYC